MKYLSIGFLIGWVIVVVALASGIVFKAIWKPVGMFPSCVAVDWVSWLGLVLGISAMVLVVIEKVRK